MNRLSELAKGLHRWLTIHLDEPRTANRLAPAYHAELAWRVGAIITEYARGETTRPPVDAGMHGRCQEPIVTLLTAFGKTPAEAKEALEGCLKEVQDHPETQCAVVLDPDFLGENQAEKGGGAKAVGRIRVALRLLEDDLLNLLRELAERLRGVLRRWTDDIPPSFEADFLQETKGFRSEFVEPIINHLQARVDAASVQALQNRLNDLLDSVIQAEARQDKEQAYCELIQKIEAAIGHLELVEQRVIDAIHENGPLPGALQAPANMPSPRTRALALLLEHPDWTDAKIAAAAGVHPKSLYRWPDFVRARKELRRSRADLPRGEKSSNVEAWDE